MDSLAGIVFVFIMGMLTGSRIPKFYREFKAIRAIGKRPADQWLTDWQQECDDHHMRGDCPLCGAQ